jgi:hypothetical protein
MKTILVSTAQLRKCNNQLIAIGVFILLMGAITGLRVFDGDYMLLFVIPMIFIVPISIYKQYTKLRSIAYD